MAKTESERKAVLSAYFRNILTDPSCITPKTDLNVEKSLNLKLNQQTVQFSFESHQQKAALLVKSLAKNVLKRLSTAESCTEEHVSLIALLLLVIRKSGRTDYKVPLTT